MGHIGINMSTVYRHNFVQLMKEAGYDYISLDGLRVHLGAVNISTERKCISEAPASLDYPYWNKSLQASLELLIPEVRMAFISITCEEHLQTQLSSVEHLV